MVPTVLKINYLIIFLLISGCSTQAQETNFAIERNTLGNEDADYGYYLAIKPKSGNIEGAIVLMPGFGQKAENVFVDSDLHRFAYENNLLTVAFTTNRRMLADSLMQSKIDGMLNHVKSKYKVSYDKFVFGGFSAGGRILLRYVELCIENPDIYPVQPVAVFMADAPIDVFHSWKMMQKLKEAANSEVAVNEANWVERIYREQYNTTPQENPELFEPYNPFSLNEHSTRNEYYLKDIAVRAYHDVDIPWRIYERNQSVRNSNYLVTSELINRLRLMGNNKAEFIQSYQNGYRANGNRHPHSWSIIDEKDCIEWILENLGNSPSSKLDDKEIVLPFSISKKNLSGLKMQRGRNPLQPDRLLMFSSVFRGKELSVQVISSENASASPENLEIDEFLFITNGGAILVPKNSSSNMSFLKGDFFLVPRGYNGYWETVGAPNFHHELSITTTQRNQSPPDTDKMIPVLMDKEKIAGIGITEVNPGQYLDVLYEGHELTITLEGETPQVREFKMPQREQIIYIAAGGLTLWDISGKSHHFETGDFVVIPDGFKGTWKSDSQDVFRFMKISKTNW